MNRDLRFEELEEYARRIFINRYGQLHTKSFFNVWRQETPCPHSLY